MRTVSRIGLSAGLDAGGTGVVPTLEYEELQGVGRIQSGPPMIMKACLW